MFGCLFLCVCVCVCVFAGWLVGNPVGNETRGTVVNQTTTHLQRVAHDLQDQRSRRPWHRIAPPIVKCRAIGNVPRPERPMKRRSLNLATWFLMTAVALRSSALQFSSLPARTVTSVPSSTPPRHTTRNAVGRVLLERQWLGSDVQITHGLPVRTSSPPSRADGAVGSPMISDSARSAHNRSALDVALAGDDDDDSPSGGDISPVDMPPDDADTCISLANSMATIEQAAPVQPFAVFTVPSSRHNSQSAPFIYGAMLTFVSQHE